MAIIHPKASFTTQDDLDSKFSRRLTGTMSAEEDLLAGTISFWAVSYKEAAIRFLGMPRHSAMLLLVNGIVLKGCQMDSLGKRLLTQYGADVSKVKVVEEKEVKSRETQQTPKTKQTLSTTWGSLFKRQSHYSNQELLTQANQLVAGISHEGTKKRFGLKQRLWSSPKTNPPITSSSSASSSSSSSSSTLYSSTSSSRSATTSHM